MRLATILMCLLSLTCCDTTAPDQSAVANPPATRELGLHEVASFPIGGAINVRKVLKDDRLKAITTREFNSITSTNDMKMYRIAKRPDTLDFSRADSTVAFAREHNQRVFGHALVWHYALPEHIEEKTPRELRDFLTEYIDTVVSRYQGEIDGWDVVNEVLNTSGGGMRHSPFYEKMGREYIDLAFRTARTADPKAKLFINDFGTERDSTKLNSLLQLVHDLRADEVPIDGIGFQWHLQMQDDTNVIRQHLRKAAATGLLIHVSELDLIFNTHNDQRGGGVADIQQVTPAMLQLQAERFETVARIYCQEVPPAQRYGITFWDFTDRDTWIKGFFDMGDWPTIYDENLQPKPGYYGFKKGL